MNIQSPTLLIRHLSWIPVQLLHALIKGEFWRLIGLLSAFNRWRLIRAGRRQRREERVVSDRVLFQRFSPSERPLEIISR